MAFPRTTRPVSRSFQSSSSLSAWLHATCRPAPPCGSIRWRRCATNEHERRSPKQAATRSVRVSSFPHAFLLHQSDFVINFMIPNLRLAFRSLIKTPGFTIVAVVTVALAIAANTAVFSLVNALLIRPLPFQAPQNLILLFEKFSAQGLDQIPVSAPEYLDWEKQSQTYERIGAFNFTDFNLTGGDMPERIAGAVVTPSLFPLLGVAPIKGRVFNDTEFGEGNDTVVMISERLWRRRFNSDPQLVGTAVQINGRSYTVIGIMPAKFEFPLPLLGVQGGTFAERADIWKPIAFTKNELESRGSRSYGVVGRLKPGVTVAQAQAEADTIVANWHKLFPDNYEPSTKFGATIYPLHDLVIGGKRAALMGLLWARPLGLPISWAHLLTQAPLRAGGRGRELANPP